MSDELLQPNDAINLLARAIALPGLAVVPAYVSVDLANLRRAHTDDQSFARAVGAVAKEIVVVSTSAAIHGVAVEFELAGWRRSKFASSPDDAANFRLIFRERKGGVEISHSATVGSRTASTSPRSRGYRSSE